jgi:hypothetical protein
MTQGAPAGKAPAAHERRDAAVRRFSGLSNMMKGQVFFIISKVECVDIAPTEPIFL